jgi:hypothetical protein
MTEDQRGVVWQQTAIFVLGMLLPHATGNEFHLAPATSSSSSSTTMDLEERLAQAPHLQQICRNDTWMDPTHVVAWHTLVEEGLPLLWQSSGGAAGTPGPGAADLLHVLALALCPHMSRPEVAAQIARELSQQHALVQRLFRLASCPTAAYFYLQDVHRTHLVQTLYAHWPASTHADDTDDNHDTVEWRCGMAHLQASLGAWGRRQTTAAALAWAVQDRLCTAWPRAWATALNRLVQEDRLDYHPEGVSSTCCRWTEGVHAWKGARPLPPAGCPHLQRGYCLATLIREAPPDCLDTALTALGDALEWQLDAWTVDEDDAAKAAPIPCLVMALLGATRTLLKTMNLQNTDTSVEHFDGSLSSSLQLLRHDEPAIREATVGLLEMAWIRGGLTAVPYAGVLLTTLQQETDLERRMEWTRLVGVMSRASPSFAKQLMETLTPTITGSHALVAAVATNAPGSLSAAVLEVALVKADGTQALSMVSAILALRQSIYFNQGSPTWDRISGLMENRQPWDRYRMALFALTNGEYAAAVQLIESVSQVVTSRKYYLWLQVLVKVAKAESLLAKDATLGIPSASVLLHDALAYLDGLQTRNEKEDYSFQIRFLLLRLDILDLVTVLRQFLREMRLTGELPTKGTRTFHLVPMIFRSFLKLARQFGELERRFALLFQSRRSSTCLAALRDCALFLAQVTKAAFGSILPGPLLKLVLPKLSTKLQFPLNQLLRELDGLVVQPMGKAGHSGDGKTTAEALLQVLDGVMLVPLPYPKDFTAPLSVVPVTWTVRPSPAHVAQLAQSNFTTVESFPSISAEVCLMGCLENPELLTVPVRAVVLSYHMTRLGPLDDEGAPEAPATKAALPTVDGIVVPVDAQGRFATTLILVPLLEEGWYGLETRVAAQTVHGRTHALAVASSSRPKIRMRTARSR